MGRPKRKQKKGKATAQARTPVVLRIFSRPEDDTKSGRLKGGCHLTLQVQSVGDGFGSRVLGKKCTIRILEIDRGKFGGQESAGDKGDLGKTEDLLAIYEAEIKQDKPHPNGRFSFANVKRVWPEKPEALPPPKKYFTTVGNLPLPFAPQWTPPYFKLSFEISSSDGAIGSISPEEIVLIKGDEGEREGYIYEFGCDLTLEGEEEPIYVSPTQAPKAIDCVNLLIKNGVQAIKFYKDNHEQTSRTRKVTLPNGSTVGLGLHCGTNFPGDENDAEIIRAYGITPTNCITYVQHCCVLAHAAMNAGADWKWVMADYETAQNAKAEGVGKGGSGLHIIRRLIKLGWQCIYFNRDVKNPYDGLPYHTQEYEYAKQHVYYPKAKLDDPRDKKKKAEKIMVIDSIVNFAPSETVDGVPPKKPTPPDGKQIQKWNNLKMLEFALVDFKGGAHTALYHKGDLYEVHWSAGPYATGDVLGTEPWVELDGTGTTRIRVQGPLYEAQPLEKHERPSGLIVVPPGTWDKTKGTIRG